MQEQIFQFYSHSQMGGGGIPVFAGARRPGMVGGGFFSTLARFAIPVLKRIGGHALRVAAKTATDFVDHQRPLGQALVDNTIEEVRSALKPAINKQEGGAMKRHIINDDDDIFTQRRRRQRG